MFFRKKKEHLIQIYIGLDLEKVVGFIKASSPYQDPAITDELFPWSDPRSFSYPITWLCDDSPELFFHEKPKKFTQSLSAMVTINDDLMMEFYHENGAFFLAATHKGDSKLILAAPLGKVLEYRERGKQEDNLKESKGIKKNVSLGEGSSIEVMERESALGVEYGNSIAAVSFSLQDKHFDLRK